jgi:hypothetical protein
MATSILIAPNPGASFLSRNGNTYTADDNGIIRDVPNGTEVQDLQSSGCNLVTPGRYPVMMIRDANLNTEEDQRFDRSLIGSGSWFIPDKVVAVSAKGPVGPAVVGIYTQNDKGGDKLASLTLGTMTGEDPQESVTVKVNGAMADKIQHGGIWLTMDTLSGEDATCNVYIYGDLISA